MFSARLAPGPPPVRTCRAGPPAYGMSYRRGAGPWSPALGTLGRALWDLPYLVPTHRDAAELPLPRLAPTVSGLPQDPQLAAIHAALEALQQETRGLGEEAFAHRILGVVSLARGARAAATDRAWLPGLVRFCLGS